MASRAICCGAGRDSQIGKPGPSVASTCSHCAHAACNNVCVAVTNLRLTVVSPIIFRCRLLHPRFVRCSAPLSQLIDAVFVPGCGSPQSPLADVALVARCGSPQSPLADAAFVAGCGSPLPDAAFLGAGPGRGWAERLGRLGGRQQPEGGGRWGWREEKSYVAIDLNSEKGMGRAQAIYMRRDDSRRPREVGWLRRGGAGG